MSCQFNLSPELVIALVSHIVSSFDISFIKIAILIDAICESENEPSVRPKTNDLISSSVRVLLSLFFLIIS